MPSTAPTRSGLSAWGQCREQRLCPPRTQCERDRDGVIRCFGSTCTGWWDPSCGAGRDCIGVTPDVFRCIPVGTAKLGETCESVFPAAKRVTCASGLGCWRGRCRNRCDEAHPCPAGACTDIGFGERMCVADLCESARDCPPQHACTALDGLPRSCVKLARMQGGKLSCVPGGCPKEEACGAEIQMGELFGKCRKRCSDVPADPCPEGFVCGAGDHLSYFEAPSVCYRVCTLETVFSVCDPGEVCGRVVEGSEVMGCVPEVQADFSEPEMTEGTIPDKPVAEPAWERAY